MALQLPTLPGANAMPAMPTMPGVTPMAAPAATATLPQLPQLAGTSPVAAPDVPAVPGVSPAGQGLMDAIRNHYNAPQSWPTGGNSANPWSSMPAWMQGMQHQQAMHNWQGNLGSAAMGVPKAILGMGPGSSANSYTGSIGDAINKVRQVAANRPAPNATTLSGPMGGMLSHVFGPYTG